MLIRLWIWKKKFKLSGPWNKTLVGFHMVWHSSTSFVVDAVIRAWISFVGCCPVSAFIVYCKCANKVIHQIRWKLGREFSLAIFVNFVPNCRFRNPANFFMLIAGRSSILSSFNCVAIFYQATTTKWEMCHSNTLVCIIQHQLPSWNLIGALNWRATPPSAHSGE